MSSNNELKDLIKNKYGFIAKKADEEEGCGCGGEKVDYTTMSEDYSGLNGYEPEADLSLGCGLPTEHAGIKPGDTVLDLGSGAGNDAFIARGIVGDSGKVIGVDFTDEMLDKANINKKKAGFDNVEFLKGDIETLPIPDNSIDVVISNCVLNLVPDKDMAFSEIFRVLKPGGTFSVSDITLQGELPEGLQKSAEMYAGCVAGAMQLDDYLELITKRNFKKIKVKSEKKINIPSDILNYHLNSNEVLDFVNSDKEILSVTINAEK